MTTIIKTTFGSKMEDKSLDTLLEEFYSEHSHMLEGRDITSDTISNYVSDYFLWRYVLLFTLGKSPVGLSQAKILDAGCGNARSLMRLIENGASPVNCYGIDGAEKAIEYCKEMFPRLQFELGMINDMPYSDDQFDICTCLGVLLHIQNNKDIEACFKELHRVMKKDSLVFITVPANSVIYPGSVAGSIRTFNVHGNEVQPLYSEYFDTLNVHGYARATYDFRLSELTDYADNETRILNGSLPADYFIYALKTK